MRIAAELLLIILGCAISAFGINEFIVPAHLLSGGLTGICLIFFHFFGWPVGTQYFVFNIPLLVIGHIFIGKKFSIYTIFGVVVLSFCLNIIQLHTYWTHDVLLSAIFGGIVLSAGGAIVLRAGGSLGGLDIPGRIIAKYKNITIGRFSLVINSVIVLISAYLFDVQTALFTLISIFTGAKTYESLLHHVDRITVLIITSNGKDVSKAITKAMRRGVTMWNASGAYTDSEKQVLLCVIVYLQLSDLQQAVLSHDEKAFISVIPTQSVVGSFHQIW